MCRLNAKAPFLVPGLVGLAAGIFLSNAAKVEPARADDAQAAHAQSVARDKAPIKTLLHCPLAFAGVHLLKELPEHSRVAYHFCTEVNGDLNQCVLYDGTGPDAKLIGIEYLVSDAVYQKMPPEEKAFWHDHKYEVDGGYLKSLTQTGDEEQRTLGKIRTSWGKVYHTWASGTDYPRGPARLFWSVTGEQPFVLSPDAELPVELARAHRTK